MNDLFQLFFEESRTHQDVIDFFYNHKLIGDYYNPLKFQEIDKTEKKYTVRIECFKNFSHPFVEFDYLLKIRHYYLFISSTNSNNSKESFLKPKMEKNTYYINLIRNKLKRL